MAALALRTLLSGRGEKKRKNAHCGQARICEHGNHLVPSFRHQRIAGSSDIMYIDEIGADKSRSPGNFAQTLSTPPHATIGAERPPLGRVSFLPLKARARL